jgi:RNA-splicing ligase RtcB
MPPPVAGFELLDEHEVGGRRRTLCAHRKGATRALGPGHPELPDPTRHGPAGR